MGSDPLTEGIIGAAIEVHRLLGPGLLESIYEEALCVEMELRGMRYQRRAEVDVTYKGHIIKGMRVDIRVAGQVIVGLNWSAIYQKSPQLRCCRISKQRV